MKRGGRLILWTALALALSSVGVGYGAWSENLRVDTTVATAQQSYHFSAPESCRAYVCAGEEKTAVTLTAQPDHEKTAVTVTGVTSELLQKKDAYLRIECPIEAQDANSVPARECPPDKETAPVDTVAAAAVPAGLTVCGLPCDGAVVARLPVQTFHFDVWQGTETVAGQLRTVILLQPRAAELGTKVSLALPYDDLPAEGQKIADRGGKLTAEAQFTYTIPVSCVVSQFNEQGGQS